MRRERLRVFVREWGGPASVGLAGAAVLITGAEIGGPLGWLLIGLAAATLIGVVVWAMYSLYTADGTDDDA